MSKGVFLVVTNFEKEQRPQHLINMIKKHKRNNKEVKIAFDLNFYTKQNIEKIK